MNSSDFNPVGYNFPPIDLLNRTQSNEAMLPLGTVFNSPDFHDTTMQLPCAIGKTADDKIFMFDLAKEHHLLVAGATGQGKSNTLNALICSLLY